MNSLTDEFVKLFYSRMTESEIKKELGLTHSEYHLLLNKTKKLLGLSPGYRRKPQLYDKYTKYSSYVLEINYVDDTYKILAYRPCFSLAKEVLENDVDINPFCEYCVEEASDENLVRLIHHEFLVKNHNWEDIMNNLKLPYQKFYNLLNKLKKNEHINSKSNKESRFVYYYAPTNKYVIKKRINGKQKCFGYYNNKETAIKVRDYLESVDWDLDLFENIKTKIKGGEYS